MKFRQLDSKQVKFFFFRVANMLNRFIPLHVMEDINPLS